MEKKEDVKNLKPGLERWLSRGPEFRSHIHIRQLMTACNSSSRGSSHAHILMSTHTHKIKNKTNKTH